jgi:excisionase family DNA binding protein
LENYFTIREVADRLRKSEQSVVRWLKAGKLSYIEVSERRRLIAKTDLQDFLNSRRVSPPKKRIDKLGIVNPCSSERSLTTSGEREAEMDVKSLRKEISQLCQL